MNNLKTELDPSKVKLIWETFRQDNKFFKSFLPEDIKNLSEVSKTLKIFRGDTLCKSGEKLSWFGIILLGQVGVYLNNEKLNTLKVSDIINYMFILPGTTHHSFDFQVLQPGYISVIFLSDFPKLSTSFPLLFFKLVQVMCLKCINTISIQYLNQDFLRDPKVIWSEYPSKKVQEYINKIPEVLSLTSQYFDKNEVKMFQSACKVLHIDSAKSLIEAGNYESCIFVMVSGEVACSSSSRVLRENDVIGLPQFFLNMPWPCSLTTVTQCDVLVIHRRVFNLLASRTANSAIRVYRMLHRLYLNQMKKSSRFSFQSYFLDFHPSLFFPAEHKFWNISAVDVICNSHNILPKAKEPPGQFLLAKFQQQAIKAKEKQKRIPQKYSKDYLKEMTLKTESGFVRLEDELEDTVLYREEVKKKMVFLQEELEKLKVRNQELCQILKIKQQEKGVLGVKMRLNDVMKDIENLEEVRSSMKNPFFSLINRTFYDITSLQIKSHREHTLALKYSEKWKNFVRKRKDFRKLQQKTRFWPGE